MKLHPKQQEIVRSKARFKVIRAGRRGGKTFLEIEEMSFEATHKKDRNIFYLAPNQTQARDIIWEALKSRLSGIGEANESRLEMKVPTQDGGHSLIKIAGWENRENFRGKNAHLIVFDELDTMKNFFIGWQEIFRPALMDTKGRANFIGTPKKENPNLRRLEKIAETDSDYETFHYRTEDNPFIPTEEIEKAEDELNYQTFRQEILAEYVDSQGALFNYTSTVDVFSNTIDKIDRKYLIVDIAGDGSDKTKFSFWEGLEEYRRETFTRLNTESIIDKIRDYAKEDKIPYSQIAVDAIGIGEGVATSSMLDGIIGFKSSYQAIKTDQDIVRLPNVSYTSIAPMVSDYKNLRSQCIFTLSSLVNNHKIASRVEGKDKENIIEELTAYQDASQGDGKRFATPKEDIKDILGRSPDDSDTWVMRMYFVIKERMLPGESQEMARVRENQNIQFDRNFNNQQKINSCK